MAGNNIFICQCDAFIHKNMPGAAEMITYTSHMELAVEEGVFEKKINSENVVSVKEMDLLLQNRMLNVADLLQGTVVVSRM